MNSSDDTDSIISMYRSGMKQIEVATALGRSQHYVSKRLIASGQTRTRKENAALKMKARPFVPCNEIVDMYRGGLSSVEIGAKLGKAPDTILRHIRTAGATRTAGETLRIRAKRTLSPVRIGSHGYPVISIEGEDRLVHRLVVEKLIGRPLAPNEEVHHKNRVRADSSPENLLLVDETEHRTVFHSLGLKCLLCERKAVARGLCGKHYQKARKGRMLTLYPRFTNKGPRDVPLA